MVAKCSYIVLITEISVSKLAIYVLDYPTAGCSLSEARKNTQTPPKAQLCPPYTS